MTAIFKREFKAYFNTPVGYIVLAAFYFFLGLYFYVYFSNGSPAVSEVIIQTATVAVFAMPIITMRLMSEDRRQKVDQALITAPVKLTHIVLGKFFAAFSVFALCYVPTIIFEIIVATKISVNVLSFLYALLGILLLGGALIAIGMFISCLTESPALSAILTLVINILVLYMSNFASMVSVPEGATNFSGKVWEKIVSGFAIVLEKAGFITAVQNFAENILSISDIVYFVSIIAVFVFLSVRSLEKRRWS
ncbi:MAG: ABC transporter permease [Acutalibacteraceae bacterium]|nr:ABC transporter permease [Acutalibacteraceae bacterium]